MPAGPARGAERVVPGAERPAPSASPARRVRRLLAPVSQVAYQADGRLRQNALLNGILVVRWCVLVWFALLLASGVSGIPWPEVAWLAFALTAGWTVWVTLGRPRWSPAMLVGDLVVAALLLVLAALVPGLATIYPVTASLTWGARLGFRGGSLSGAALGAVYVGAGALGGLVPGAVDEQLFNVMGDALSLVLAGGGLGLVSTLIHRSTAELESLQADRLRAREEAARLAEREALARQIHDSVLQVLSLVHKRGRELAAAETASGAAVARLADLAAQQEAALRELVLGRSGPAAPAPGGSAATDGAGTVLVRAVLDAAARRHAPELEVQVSAAGEPALAAPAAAELGSAVDQALANVVRHAGTRRAWLFAEEVGGEVVVSVRDDGRGFVLDEAALRAGGRLGLRHSIRGRVEQLGGSVVVETAPGRGTELELRVPLPDRDTAASEHDGRHA